ncbi:MAG: FkbM family methyltransferase, partial [Tissierellales bacterium]|nr:FkbM family methyltransferase [Tissierellales bacterium]
INDIIDIEEVYDFLEDWKSQKILINLLYYRMTYDYQYILEIVDSSFEQYFDTDIIRLTAQEVFIDAGAYIGDTLEAFVSLTKNKFKKIYCYEPDNANFNQLKDMVSKLKIEDRVSLINKGVHYQEDVFLFEEKGSSSSHICENGNIKIDVCSITDTIQNIPTYIKMDIEGSEIEALYGLKDMIKKHKPKLAICVYHKNDDLWRIPLILKRWVPEYQIFLRHYFPNQYETVCYAVIR